MSFDAYFAAQDEIVAGLPDLRKYDNQEAAAKALYAALRAGAERLGMNPDIEVSIFEPGAREENPNGWWVMWESGPHDWAIDYTLDGRNRTYAKTFYLEPYWGFDVIFTPTGEA